MFQSTLNKSCFAILLLGFLNPGGMGQDDVGTLHSAAVKAVLEGASMKSVAPKPLREKAQSLGIRPRNMRKGSRRRSERPFVGAAAQASTNDLAGADVQDKPSGLTLGDIIAGAEAREAASGRRVHAVIEASPAACEVSYSPVIGGEGDILDGGLTTANLNLAPRFYFFSCKCPAATQTQRLDCFDDCRTKFQCQ